MESEGVPHLRRISKVTMFCRAVKLPAHRMTLQFPSFSSEPADTSGKGCRTSISDLFPRERGRQTYPKIWKQAVAKGEKTKQDRRRRTKPETNKKIIAKKLIVKK